MSEQSWSTKNVAANDALSYWTDIVCANLLDLRIGCEQRSRFAGEMAKHSFGPLNAHFISVSEQRVSRSDHRSKSRDAGIFHLIQVRGGVQLVEHGQRQSVVRPGNCILVDCQSSFDFIFPQGVDALVLEFRRDWLRSWVPAVEEGVARLIGSESGWGATLSSALSNLMPHSMDSLGISHAILAEQIAVLLAAAISPTGPPLTSHRRSLLLQVTNAIRERYHEPDLDPAAIASMLGLSRRYVHRLLASSGTTFTRELYSIRLRRAQLILADKRFGEVSIAEIAWSCGFSVPSHFTRRFRDEFGVPPVSYRMNASCNAAS